MAALSLKLVSSSPDIVLRLPEVYLIWQMQLKSPGVGGQDLTSLPACLSAGVFAHSHMTFEITQLWGQIACSSLQGPERSSLRQMFSFEPMSPQPTLLFLSSRTTGVKRAHTCFRCQSSTCLKACGLS